MSFTIRKQEYFNNYQEEIPQYPIQDPARWGERWQNLDTILFGDNRLLTFNSEQEAVDWLVDLIKSFNVSAYEYWQETGKIPSYYQIVSATEIVKPALSPCVQELIESLAASKERVVERSMSFYFIKTSQKNLHHHDELHSNYSSFVVTTCPSPGDEIVYVLLGKVAEVYQINPLTQHGPKVKAKASISLFSYTLEKRFKEVKLRVLSHPGRSAMLGEDGLDVAFGNECLATLWLEKLDGADWSYAPCDVELIEEPDRKEQGDEAWWRWRFDDELTAAWSEQEGWQLQDTTVELDKKIDEFNLKKHRETAIAYIRSKVDTLSQKALLDLVDRLLLAVDENSQEWNTRMRKQFLSGKSQISYLQNSVTWTIFRHKVEAKLTPTGVSNKWIDDELSSWFELFI